jgi:DNA-directed RNA polymerase specialized sigma24 family protein
MSERAIYEVTTWREEGWWVIDIPEFDLATQARRLDQVESMARDAVATWLDVSPDSFDVRITPQFDEDLTKRLSALRAERERAEQAQARATAEARQLAVSLHAEGLKVRDIGHMLGVSYQRAQQLIQESRRTA